MDKQLLITAFLPFDQREENQSLILANRLTQPNVTILPLPVIYKEAFMILKGHLKNHQYDAILSLGEGPNTLINLEHLALNIMHARIPDANGYQPKHKPILKSEPMTLSTTLPLKHIRQELSKNELPYADSFHAGTYVCNDLFYRLMHLPITTTRGFIHVPNRSEFRDQMLKALKIITAILLHR